MATSNKAGGKVYTAADLEAMESVDQTDVQKESVERPTRREIALGSEFSPASLCGSWALYHSPATDDTYSKTEQGLVVAEPQAGIYLVQLYDLVEDVPREQRIIDLATLGRPLDDEGGRWTFYDDRDAVRRALKGMIR